MTCHVHTFMPNPDANSNPGIYWRRKGWGLLTFLSYSLMLGMSLTFQDLRDLQELVLWKESTLTTCFLRLPVIWTKHLHRFYFILSKFLWGHLKLIYKLLRWPSLSKWLWTSTQFFAWHRSQHAIPTQQIFTLIYFSSHSFIALSMSANNYLLNDCLPY